MAFFLVDRDREDGPLRLLSGDMYVSRQEALAALPSLVDAADSESRDVFVCDLDAATPVLFVAQATVPAPDVSPVEEDEVPVVAEEEAVGVWEAPAEEPELTNEDVLEDVALEGPGLADALRRAATSLESEGIVAPESVPVASEPQEASVAEDLEISEDAVEEPETDFADELSSAIASLGIAEPMSEQAETPAEDDDAVASTTEWPWANVEKVDEAVESEADEEIEAVASIDDETLIMANPEAVDFTPRPVIMGDYGDETPIIPDELEDLLEATTDETVDETLQTEGESVEPIAEVAELAEEETAEQAIDMPTAYEPGELELDEYSCDDCVYSNTCPKAGSSNPAECGSFQWKST